MSTTRNKNNTPAQQGGSSRIVAAATVILLLACGRFAYCNYSQSTELQELKAVSSDLQTRLDSAANTLDKIYDEQKLIKNPNITVVNMVGSQVVPQVLRQCVLKYRPCLRIPDGQEYAQPAFRSAVPVVGTDRRQTQEPGCIRFVAA